MKLVDKVTLKFIQQIVSRNIFSLITIIKNKTKGWCFSYFMHLKFYPFSCSLFFILSPLFSWNQNDACKQNINLKTKIIIITIIIFSPVFFEMRPLKRHFIIFYCNTILSLCISLFKIAIIILSFHYEKCLVLFILFNSKIILLLFSS